MESVTRDMPLEDLAVIHCLVKPYLMTAGIIVRRLAKEPAESTWRVVHLSVLMLGEYLTGMIKFFLQTSDRTPGPWFGRNALAPQLMNQAGRCPSLSRTLVDQDVDQSSIFYLSRMIKRDINKDHHSCSPSYCVVDKLDLRTYKTKHADECQDLQTCSPVILDSPEWVSLMVIIEKRQVSLLTVTEGGIDGIKVSVTSSEVGMAFSGLESHVSLVSGTREYVCISHVWSE